MNLQEDQVARLSRIAACARDIRTLCSDGLTRLCGRVHLRPTDSGITLVGLLPERPQRGRGGYSPNVLNARFDSEFERQCVNIEQGRPTPEKALQSFIISSAYKAGRRLGVLKSNGCSENAFDSVWFVTDELAGYLDGEKVVCDLLAVRREGDFVAPVLIELKAARQMTRLVEQLQGYARFIRDYARSFEQLYSEVLGEDIHFTGNPEMWLVWPGPCSGPDNQEIELARSSIGVVQYKSMEPGFQFHVGRAPEVQR